MHTPSHSQRGMGRVVFISLGLLALVIGIAVHLLLRSTHEGNEPIELEYGSYLYQQGIAFPDFALVNQNNVNISKSDIEGSWYLWFFGFTHCPDICPTTMSTLTTAKQRITSENPEVALNVAFVTVDPQRDNPQRLHEYLGAFDAKIIGITGSEQNLAELRNKLGILALRVEDTSSAAGPLFDHSSSVYLTAPDGKIAALFPAPHELSAVSKSFLKIHRNLSR